MNESLIYLYGVVPADAPEPPPELAGLEAKPVQLLRTDGVAGVVSEVPAAEFAPEVLDERLTDLAWVGERGMAHERVLTWFADRGPVVPLAPFSLHRDAARARSRLAADVHRFRETLARLRGCREWGIKLRRVDARLGEHLAELSPRWGEMAREMANAPPGRRFLLGKKAEGLRAEELRALGAITARQVYEAVRAAAEHGKVLPLPAQSRESGAPLVLHAAFLVEEASFPVFQQRVSEAAHRHGAVGFDLEFTGPWPPYHFVDADEP